METVTARFVARDAGGYRRKGIGNVVGFAGAICGAWRGVARGDAEEAAEERAEEREVARYDANAEFDVGSDSRCYLCDWRIIRIKIQRQVSSRQYQKYLHVISLMLICASAMNRRILVRQTLVCVSFGMMEKLQRQSHKPPSRHIALRAILRRVSIWSFQTMGLEGQVWWGRRQMTRPH